MSSEPSGKDHLRFSPIHADDHAGYLWIITILATIYSFLAAILRVHIKWGKHGIDDYLLLSATVVKLAQSAVVFYGLNNGLAKFNSITTEYQWQLSGKSFFAVELLSILALCLAKCSVIALMLRMFAIKMWKNLLCAVLLFLAAAWGVGSIIGLAINCSAVDILTDNNTQCPQQYLRWKIITAIDIITELLICLLPIALVWSLNMSFNLKCQVFTAFSFRIPLIVASALHLAYFKKYPTSAEPQFDITNSLLIQQVMLTWSLISATIPNLKSFMMSFSMILSFQINMRTGDQSSNNTYTLRSFRRGTKAKTTSRSDGTLSSRERSFRKDDKDRDNQELKLRPDGLENMVTVVHSSDTTGHEIYMTRKDSQELIIKRDVQWDVCHEPW
ncbi:uncharacterized protein BCR38DRAFT_443484 [Pseudomassariella vexata]|uniref:Rhodopsin domain-containing protein n=1 Tax=Pseudomassariella vexata TaxID=1141098 RepID=A0A1Y2DLE4_9PEZI|nr:uncharacterized protein BCR38DRAFT_443484 [Pseudomassariella vexata]ORY59964.1 hypothetical protein BCR38DRAFT_443484 [Pseudomassariella vexata]